MILTATNQIIEISTSSAGNLAWNVSYVDHTSSGGTLGANQGEIVLAATTTIVAAPGSSTQRQVVWLSLINTSGSVAQTISVIKDVASANLTIYTATLYPGQRIEFWKDRGFVRYNAGGEEMTSNSDVRAQSSVMLAQTFSSSGTATTKTITSGSTFAVYIGKAPRALSSVQVRSRVTTAMATITWGEMAIAKGVVNFGGNPTLTVVGFADISGSHNSTGLKTTTINLQTGQNIGEGDDLWVLIGNSATTALQVRAPSIPDDLQTGAQASAAVRPSTIVGSGTVFTIEAFNAVSAWVALLI